MASTTTTTTIEDAAAGRYYRDDEWSYTTVNYYKDLDATVPIIDTSHLSEHEIRVQRRSEETPTIARTPVRIHNIQGTGDNYSIDAHGFTIGHLESEMEHWKDNAELKRVYFPEVTELLKRETGARHVFQYEWHVRSTTLEEGLANNSTGAVDITGPVRRVHIDETPASAAKEYNYYMKPNEVGNEHLKGRAFGIYNVWRPIRTIRKDPLCLCDVRTTKDEDFKVTAVTVPNMGEIENVSLRPPRAGREHGFVYVREQQPEQALVFRIYDSRVDGSADGKRSHGVAHTSFVDPGTENDEPRQSVEVRNFCVF